ncbi:MAG: glycosyltransferase family 2 protein [Agriterribacter sp.]
MPLTSIIIPVYNEEENIIPLYEELRTVTYSQTEIIWVDDGSTDNSLQKIAEISAEDNLVKCISFSRNFGHQAALIAGLHYAAGNYIVIMDSDFQHPPQLIPQFLHKLNEGYDIVSGKRIKTQNISVLKKYTGKLYYKLINFLSDTHIEENVADFRAFNRRVLDAILQFEEKEIFLRGVFGWIGFKKVFIEYNAPGRKYGQTKYSSPKMISLGLRGVISFSFKPLRVSLLIGSIISLVSFLLAINAVFAYLNGNTVPGWTSIIIAIMFFGGIQLLFLGLIGEYISSLFIEVKKRPKYIVKETINVS